MIERLTGIAGGDGRVVVGPQTADDAGVFRFGDRALVATADFITPVCDDARRFGRVAATNALSDVFAMGGRALFGLNLCCFPGIGFPLEEQSEILEGAAEALRDAGAALLGGHSVRDNELKFGLALLGDADPDRLLTNAGARAGQRLLLTKPLGTGVLINAYKLDKTDAAGLEPAMEQMEILNLRASELALSHGVSAATDVTGFGLAGHALEIARASAVGLRLRFEALRVLPGFYELARAGVSTGCTGLNRRYTEAAMGWPASLAAEQLELLFDPQTSGGLLLAVPAEQAGALLDALLASGHAAAEIGEVVAGDARLEIL
ncbi:MAG: selenide, water dikinase SelD [Acidobacteria bacterium]|nr:selenide, water dikinase SelD [Acidobacteriota bacterium]